MFMYSEFFLTLRTLSCCAGVALRKQESVKNAHKFAFIADKTANNSVLHIVTIMIFGGILEGVWPVNNKKRFLMCNFRYQSKSGITGFFKHLNYSIYKPSQVEDVVL